MGKIVAVANQKGGVGKTTTAVNLSACVAAQNRRVLLLDIDPQGNSTSGLGLDKSQTGLSVYDAILGGRGMHEIIRPTMMDMLSLAPSSIKLAGAEIELVSVMAREQVLKGLLDPVLNQYDYIFIDCPPSLGLLTLNALTAAHRLLVPIPCEFYALEGLSQLMNTVTLVHQRLNPGLRVEGVVLTMFDSRTNLSNQVAAEVRKYFKERVYDTAIPRNVRLSEAPSFGLPINLYDPTCAGAEAYRLLAHEFISSNEKNRYDR